MSRIYDLPDGRKACIYSEGNRIMFHAFPARNGGTTAVLKEDYGRDLTSVMFYGTIYFAYINTQNELVFDGIGAGEEEIIPAWTGAHNIELAVMAGNIILFYMTCEERKNIHCLYMCSVYGDGRHSEVIQESEKFQYHIVQMKNTVMIIIFRDMRILFQKIWAEGGFKNAVCQESELLTEGLRKECEQLRIKVQENERAFRNELEAERYRSGRLRETVGEYEKEIRYAKQKYDELAGFAGRLQDAVKQWREKYMEEIR